MVLVELNRSQNKTKSHGSGKRRVAVGEGQDGTDGREIRTECRERTAECKKQSITKLIIFK